MNGKRIMAGRLQWVLTAGLLVQACLIPQDDPVLPDLPAKKNTPPHLDTDSATPNQQRGTILSLDPSCKAERLFGIIVEDPDLGDSIQVRWYVDDDGKFKSLPVNGMGIEPRPTTGAVSRGTVKPIELFYTTGKLIEPRAHHVTVVVADRPFPPDGILMPDETIDLPDGGSLSVKSRTDQYTWEVITDLTPCP